MTEFETEQAGVGAVVVRGRGRLDMAAAPTLRALVLREVRLGATRVVVDLTETPFLDSSGLGALIAGLKATRRAGGDLRIAGAGQQVRMVLELTQMHTLLPLHDDVEAALRAE